MVNSWISWVTISIWWGILLFVTFHNNSSMFLRFVFLEKSCIIYICGIDMNTLVASSVNVWLGLTASQIHFAMICSWLSQRQCGSYSTFAHHLVNSVQGEPWVTLSLKFIVIMAVIIEIRKDWAMGGRETGYGRAGNGRSGKGWSGNGRLSNVGIHHQNLF